jgi:quinoprotein glucose dehydrogenase
MKAAIVTLVSALLATTAGAQNDWPVYGHDPGGSRYSPLSRINTKNVPTLRRAWTYHTGETGRQFESTPIVVGGVMYLSTQTSRIVALQPETGKEIWSYDPKVRRPREHRVLRGGPAIATRPQGSYLARAMAA